MHNDHLPRGIEGDDLESPFGTSSGTDARITLLSETTDMMNNLLMIANLMKNVLSIKMS
jgi:hypothetical protein